MNAKIILVLMIAVLLYSCGRSGSEVPNDVIKPVKIAEVVSGSMVTKTYAGVVDAQETTDLAFTVNGQILEMNVDEGQVVTKGQLIAGLDTRDLMLQNQGKKSAYVTAKAQYERFERLYAQQAVSQQDLEEARTNYELAKVDLDIAENTLADALLYAPFSGTIEKKFVDNYQRVNYGEAIVRLVNTDNLYVSFVVADNNLMELKKADVKFSVRFNSTGNRYFTCALREYIDISVGGGGIPISLWITDKAFHPVEMQIKPGISCEVRMEFLFNDKSNWVKVPLTAVFIDPETEKETVWVMNADNILEKREVKVEGLTGIESVVISEGLTPGEYVVTAGAFTLYEGQKVKVFES